jgi:5'-methylthioadenosine phosphorylase
MTTTVDEDVLVGVIGDSCFYRLDSLTVVKQVNPKTPWGYPSALLP